MQCRRHVRVEALPQLRPGYWIQQARSAGIETVLHTPPEFNPSTTVLQRCGFRQVATTPILMGKSIKRYGLDAHG